MIAYPDFLPCASRIEGHSATVFTGVVRTPMEAGNTRQRRAQRLLPHQISLVFVMAQDALDDWLGWVNDNAFDQFVAMKLPGLLAGRQGTPTAAVPVRFISDIDLELIPAHRLWYWNAHVQAEWLPTSDDLVIRGIVAGTPEAPSQNWIIAGTPANPSPAWVVAGTPVDLS